MYDGSHAHSRRLEIKLPIAPHANHRLQRTGDEKPGAAMVPAEAAAWVQALRLGGKDIRSIELCGPGDALASPATTLYCLELLQPEIRTAELVLTTLGPGAAETASELARLGIRRVNLLVETIQAETAGKIYAWIRPARQNVPLARAAEILIAAQAAAVEALTTVGIRVVIRSTLLGGLNDGEISEIAERMAGLGAASMEINGEEGLDLEAPLLQASAHLPATLYTPPVELLPPGAPGPCKAGSMPKPTAERPNVAVVSTNGMEVDLHLGQATQVLIYGPRDDGLPCLLMARQTPDSGADRWQMLGKECLHDCFALLATHAGDAPRRELAELGVRVILTEDNIEGLVDVLYGGGKNKKCKK